MEKHTRKRPLRVSRRWRSTALWVARRSAVLARRLALRLGWGCCSVAGEVGVRGDGTVAVLVVDFGSESGFSVEGMASGRGMMAIVAKVGVGITQRMGGRVREQSSSERRRVKRPTRVARSG